MPFKGLRTVFYTPSSSSSKESSSFTTSLSHPMRSRPSSTPAVLLNLSESMIEEYMVKAKSIITKWDPNSSTFTKVTSLFQESRLEAMEFVKSVKLLQQAMHFYAAASPKSSSSSQNLVQAQTLMQIAMKRLEKEFYQILISNRDHLDPESVSTRSSISDFEYEEAGPEDEIQLAGESISEVEKFSTLAMSDLSSIAECMTSFGYARECVNIYKIIRKSIVDEALYKLGFESFTTSQIHKMDWEVLDNKIKNWRNAVKIAVKSLFVGERIVCDHVFSTSDFIRESCFSDITKEGAIQLFRFPEIVAKCHKTPEKMFRMLDLYDSISELCPDIDSIFSFESTSEVRSQAMNSLTKLGDTVRSMLSEFESAIQKDSSKTPISGGGLHPLTRYVMNFLCLLSDYSGILSDIMANCPLPENSSLPESYFENPNPDDNPLSGIATRMAWIILVLLCKLDGKAKLYTDSGLPYLFLANNLDYIVRKSLTSNLRLLLGDNWILKQNATAKEYAANFERIVWNKVLSALPESEAAAAATMRLEEAKKCFREFNLALEQTLRSQSSCVVTSSKLREEMKASIAKNLVPAYRELYWKYRPSLLRNENDTESIVRFTPDDLRNYLADLYKGTGASRSASSSLSSSPAHSPGKLSRR